MGGGAGFVPGKALDLDGGLHNYLEVALSGRRLTQDAVALEKDRLIALTGCGILRVSLARHIVT